MAAGEGPGYLSPLCPCQSVRRWVQLAQKTGPYGQRARRLSTWAGEKLYPPSLHLPTCLLSLSSLQVSGSVTSLRCCRCNLPSFSSSLHLSVSFSSGIVGFCRYFGLPSSLTSLPIILFSIFFFFYLYMKPYFTCKLETFILNKAPCKCFSLVHKNV